VPFEYVAKATLLVCLGLFVLDPFPPQSRLLALIAVGVVGILTKVKNLWSKYSLEEANETALKER